MWRIVVVQLLVWASAQPNPLWQTPTQLFDCSTTSDDVHQIWKVVKDGMPNDNILLGDTGLCLNTLGYSNSSGGILNVWV